jgi:hypothetical protein
MFEKEINMKFKDIEEGKLYQSQPYNNVYTKHNGLLFHVGNVYAEYNKPEMLHVNMYYTTYSPEFIIGRDLKEITLAPYKL